MAMKPGAKHPVGRQVATQTRGATPLDSAAGMPLPHERDESIDEPVDALTEESDKSSDESPGTASDAPDPIMVQAKRDIDAGQVDTDLRTSPGLDAKRRARLVPGPGGKPPSSRT